ncbi:hypothetical protein AgCh_015483 [Apium graveolens]
MSGGHSIIASGTLYVESVLVGVCYGSQWSLMPTIVSEIFGVHLGTIFNTITTACPLGSSTTGVRTILATQDLIDNLFPNYPEGAARDLNGNERFDVFGSCEMKMNLLTSEMKLNLLRINDAVKDATSTESASVANENGVLDADALLSWIYTGSASRNELTHWMCTKEQKASEGMEFL